MDIERISAFSVGDAGGNPAGVAIGDVMPDPAEMARIAAEVGYSETAFAAPEGDAWRVRYFAPESEVPFCGHATIALGAALGAKNGARAFDLILNDAEISVEAVETAEGWGAALLSPPTAQWDADPALLTAAMDLFGLDEADLDPAMPAPKIIGAGATFIAFPLAERERLARLDYDQAKGAALFREAGLVGAHLSHRAAERRFDARFAFPTGGVFEDPATGAAAAAFAGWLRDEGALTGDFEILQGEDMGAPSRIHARAGDGAGAPSRVWGATRRMAREAG